MRRVKLNAIVNIVAFSVLLLSLFCGIITWKVLPSGSDALERGRGVGHAIFLGLARGDWRDIHVYAGLVFAALVALHLLLHWRWILCVPRLFARSSRAKACPPDVLDTPESGSSERR